jgi:hypothetical protein
MCNKEEEKYGLPGENGLAGEDSSFFGEDGLIVPKDVREKIMNELNKIKKSNK